MRTRRSPATVHRVRCAALLAVLTSPVLAQQDWAARIEQVDANEKASFNDAIELGCELAALPERAGIDALKKAWPAIAKTSLKQQIIKAWQYGTPAPYRARLHPHVLELFQMVLADNDPETEPWVTGYVPTYSWCRFASAQAASAWVTAHRDETGEAAALVGMTAWAVRAKNAATRVEAMNDLREIGYPLRRNPQLIEAGKRLAFVELLAKGIEDPNVGYDALGCAYSMLAELDPPKYPREGLKSFLAKYEDRRVAQETALRAAECERILKEFDVRTIGRDPAKRWVFHKPLAKTPPEHGFGLLLVIPGGDGGLDFAPFVGGTIRSQAGEDYAVIQLVAPPIDDQNEEAIVWPTQTLKDARVDFTMEPIWRAAIAQVEKEISIDRRRVWAMGWSSGGPPSYAAALEADSKVRGAFVAMSVFKIEQYPTLAEAKGKAFYLLHPPQDSIPMRFPEAAKTELEKAGARVQIATYEGGHGWQGDSVAKIADAIRWLETSSLPEGGR